MSKHFYRQATFIQSASKCADLPEDCGFEVAFAGRSNAGKSSALNCLTENKTLARTSKTPGRTQLINLFCLDESRRLVDLPGYGYAKVALSVKEKWQKNVMAYLAQRQCLIGLVLLMDIRHPLKPQDEWLLHWAIEKELPTHILLTKADKLKRGAVNQTVNIVKQQYELCEDIVSVQAFSALKKAGIDDLRHVLNQWYAVEEGSV